MLSTLPVHPLITQFSYRMIHWFLQLLVVVHVVVSN